MVCLLENSTSTQQRVLYPAEPAGVAWVQEPCRPAFLLGLCCDADAISASMLGTGCVFPPGTGIWS